jgi:sugar lactone lactonase YvrE
MAHGGSRKAFGLALALALAACTGTVIDDNAPATGMGGGGASSGSGGDESTSPSSSGGSCGDTSGDQHNCGSCGHDCLGGACVNGLCQPVVLDTHGYPNGIAVDAHELYWTDLLTGVMRISLPMGTPTMVAMADTPQAVALDSGHVYWTATNTLSRAPLMGGAAAPLSSAGLKSGTWALATDGSNVYWADQGSGTLQSMPVGGGTSTVLDMGLIAPDGVVVDDTYVYYADGTNKQIQGSLLKVPKAGGARVTLATGQEGPRALALDTDNIYWTDSALYSPAATGVIMKMPKAGGMPTILTSGQGNPLGIAVAGNDVYWVNSDAGTVSRVSKDGGMPTVLAGGQSYATSITADAKAIYWTTQGQGGAVVMLAR